MSSKKNYVSEDNKGLSFMVNHIKDRKRGGLTTGPDLPVRPIGPGGPLIASCKPDAGKNKFRLSWKI